jgi:peptidoglycan/xylan/chitin deacetylase (PgdA/CDA1 family)
MPYEALRGAKSSNDLEAAMRLVAAAGTLVVVAFLAVFGAILLHERTIADPASFQPSANAATAQALAPTPLSASPVSTVSASPVSTAPVALASAVRPSPILPEPQAAVPERQPVQSFAQTPSRPAAAAPAPVASCPGNPNALGVARVVEVDTLGGPGFGFEHFKSHDFLQPGEVVLTFDDGPWPRHTPAVLAALAAHCTKAIFFPIGKHAMWEPGILKQVVAGGHAVGSHTWSHADLSKLAKKSVQEAKDEIEKGISAVRWAAGAPTAPYFRFPALRHPPELVTYLGERGVAIFSTDFDSFDFKIHKPEQVRVSVMTKLKKFGKGIILMHDFQQATAGATAELLNDLKAGGYKVVFMKPKGTLTTIASYDEAILKDAKLPTVSDRPTSSVVRTISE